MVDLHFGRALAVAVDAAVALLQAVGIPRDLVVNEAMAVALEVDAFARGVGGEQDADRRVLGVELESGFDALAVVGVLRAIEQFQTVAFLEPARGQVVMEPLLSVAVLSEDDDALLVPVAIGTDDGFEPADELVRLAVELRGSAFRPAGEVVENLSFGGRWRTESARGSFQGFQLGFLLLGVVGVVFFRLFEDAGEGAGGVGERFIARRLAERRAVAVQGIEESLRRGE